ncbi:MAG: hypothetical protein Q8K02_17415 [Flavobacterium sp.]|nr:hypothetical protein [Flavobacterium sp.]
MMKSFFEFGVSHRKHKINRIKLLGNGSFTTKKLRLEAFGNEARERGLDGPACRQAG